MNVQNMKKKTTIGAVAAVAAAAIAIGAGTYAFFSSTGDTQTSTATAGSLQLNDTWSGNFTLSGLAPGYTSDPPQTVTLENAGNLPGILSFHTTVTDSEDGCKGDEAGYDPQGSPTCGSATQGELSQKLRVTVTKNGESTPLYTGPVSDLSLPSNRDRLTSNVPANGGTVTYNFVYTFPETGNAADNAAQGDGTTITIQARLTQA